MNAKQKREVARRVKAVQGGDSKLTWHDLMEAEEAAWNKPEGPVVEAAVYNELRAWSNAKRAEYTRVAADLEALETLRGVGAERMYLGDQGIDEENVKAGCTEDNAVNYWARMCSAQGAAAGERAENYGIDLNKLLAYAVY